MVKGKTESGFEFEFDERLVKDQDFLDAILDANDSTDEMEKVSATRRLYLLVLGKKGYEALKNHIRKLNDGIAEADKVATEFGQILDAAKDLKN